MIRIRPRGYALWSWPKTDEQNSGPRIFGLNPHPSFYFLGRRHNGCFVFVFMFFCRSAFDGASASNGSGRKSLAVDAKACKTVCKPVIGSLFE